MCLGSAISDLSCYIIIIYKTWGKRAWPPPSWLTCSFPTRGVKDKASLVSSLKILILRIYIFNKLPGNWCIARTRTCSIYIYKLQNPSSRERKYLPCTTQPNQLSAHKSLGMACRSWAIPRCGKSWPLSTTSPCIPCTLVLMWVWAWLPLYADL